jgi:hypothetical protein
MTLWEDRTNQRPQETPLTHALVIGTSAYRHISDGPQPKQNIDFGLGQVTTPCAGAFAFAKWLRDEYHNPESPLGTIRLLLSPSVVETGNDPELAAAQVDRALSAPVRQALFEWHDACDGNRDNVAMFYLSGHGVQRTKLGGNVLLEDFGVDPMVVDQSVDVFAVQQGMAGDTISQRQFYFIDACRTQPDEFRNWRNLGQGLALPETFGGADERCAPIYFAASPDAQAFGRPGDGTLFAAALIESLRTLAASLDDDGRFVVSSHSLGEALEKRVASLAAAYSEIQSPAPSGLMRYGVVHVYAEPPDVPISILVDPDQAADASRLTLSSYASASVAIDNEPANPNPVERTVPMGYYTLRVDASEPFVSQSLLVDAKPRRDGSPPKPQKVVLQ